MMQKRINTSIPVHLKQQNLFGITLHNPCWRKKKHSPAGMNIHTITLDQLLTNTKLAKPYWNTLDAHLCPKDIHIQDYTFIKPSTLGIFYNDLPAHPRMDIKIVPVHPDEIQSDLLCSTAQVPNNQKLCLNHAPFVRVWRIRTYDENIPKKIPKTYYRHTKIFTVNGHPGKHCAKQALYKLSALRPFYSRPPHLTMTLETISDEAFLGACIQSVHRKALKVLGHDWIAHRKQPRRQEMHRSGLV